MKQAIILLAALTLTLSACETKREQQQEQDRSTAVIDSLRRELAASQNETSTLMETVDQIQEGFRQINEAEGRITAGSTEGGAQQSVAENMAYIQRTLRLNKELISNLQQQLRNTNQLSRETKDRFERMMADFETQLQQKGEEIAALKEQLHQKDVVIAEQGEKISNLNENVTDLKTQNEDKQRTVQQQDRQLHTAWYVFGTKRELKQQNILTRSDVMSSANVNKNYFTKIDTRVTKEFKLYSKSAELKTSHPAGSYQLEKDGQGLYTLRVTDPTTFWSVSRYLVIVVK